MLKVAFIGCVQFSYELLKTILDLPHVQVTAVVTKKQSPFNADFVSLAPLAEQYGIPCLNLEAKEQRDIAQWLNRYTFDTIFCFGWSHLLPKTVLDMPKYGVIGYHPAALPRNRGRHPIIWALALGLEETASTFFVMDEGADSGDIIDQRRVVIDGEDNAATLYRKLLETAKEQVKSFSLDMQSGVLKRIPQDHSQANYWRKRSKRDGQIDWRMTAVTIHNLVRALHPPYPGAHCLFEDQEIKIWETRVEDDLPSTRHFEPGKILKVENGEIIVKCGQGCLRIVRHQFDPLPKEGSYL